MKRSLFFKRRKNDFKKKSTADQLYDNPSMEKPFPTDINEHQKLMENAFGQSMDFKVDKVKIGQKNGLVCYLETMIDKQQLTDKIYTPLNKINNEQIRVSNKKELEEFRKKNFAGLPYKSTSNEHQIIWTILSGYVVILIDGFEYGIGFEFGNSEKRAITEPSTQTIIRGPKDGFTESLETNISLIRRRVKNPRLIFESFTVGKDTKTSVAIGYINGITNEDILNEVRERIKKIDASSILDSGNIEEFIADKSFTPFPLVLNTERPDSIAANIIEGKVVIICDGSPFLLVVPSLFIDFFQTPEDYFQPFFMASFLRIIRYSSFLITLVFPSLYVAITTYHHELLPTQLFISVQAQREGVPFPAVIEILMMELTFEVIREAGIRMPRAVGQTVSIVGALVIGQAAVEAGLVSNVLVIIVAFTAIASFVSPIYNFSISTRLLRFVLILAASVIGLYGVLVILIAMVVHLTSLRSFGVSYLKPIAPLILEDQSDTFLRFPIWANLTRPSSLMTRSPKKMKKRENPSPPQKDTGDSS